MTAVHRLAGLLVVACLGAGCGVRTPGRINTTALIAKRGAVEARRDLTIRVLAHPRDVQARLALAEISDEVGRPSDAIEQLEAVERLGGPLGTRWHDTDRERLGRLLLARGKVRLARGAPTALADLERARKLGAGIGDADLVRARIAIAITQLRHTDAKERAKGAAYLATQAKTDGASPTKPADGAPLTNTADSAVWRGAAERASPADRGAFGAWLWTVGARKAAYDELAAWHAATTAPRDEKLQAAYLRALAWWSPLWLGEVKPPPAEDLVGPERCWFAGANCVPARTEELPLPPVPVSNADPRALVAVRYASTRASRGDDASALEPVAKAFFRDATIADRLGRDYVASAADAALAQARLGALFDALGDPGRARAAWQAAVGASAEAAFLRGLAEAAARTGDGSAALVFATQGAAASGDPAVVWAAVALALVDGGQAVDALTAARNAIDLAGPEVLPRALDVAITASRELGRKAQADALLVQRAQLAPRVRTIDADAQAALLAHREQPTASTIASLWVTSRAHPRDVELRAALVEGLDADDPRRATVVGELVELAGDSDPDRAFAAVRALRR